MSDVGGNPHHWKVKATTNLLFLMLALAVLLNSLLSLGIQVWLVYDLDSPQEAIGQYADCTLVSSAERGDLQSWLLEKPDGGLQMVTTEKHVLFDQYRIVKGGTLEITEEPFTKTVWGDNALVHLLVQNHIFEGYNVTGLSMHIPSTSIRIPMVFLLYSALLIAIEIAAYCLFQKIREK